MIEEIIKAIQLKTLGKTHPKEIDFAIGSLLEAWLTRDTKGCRFCNKPLKGNKQFCSAECKKKWEKIHEARVLLGLRDLEQRGFD